MTKRVDRFENPIDVGTVIAYSGANIGLIVGVVVKLNPASYKVKVRATSWMGNDIERYHNVLFDFKDSILTAKSMSEFKPEDVLNEVEKRRLGMS